MKMERQGVQNYIFKNCVRLKYSIYFKTHSEEILELHQMLLNWAC